MTPEQTDAEARSRNCVPDTRPRADLTSGELRLRCQRLAGSGQSDHAIAAILAWGVVDVRRALSPKWLPE